jgi:menaquinone reductase, molybdopterin-binding-like subunit
MLYGESVKKKVELLVPQVVPPEDYSPGIATWYNTVCQQCSAGCGISVRIREGRAKKIEGNPLHPVSQGHLCSMGQAGVNTLYNPDRIRTPLQRAGERGSGEFTEISWDDALTSLGNTLGTLRIREHANRVFLLSGGVRGHLDVLFSKFMSEMGSGHYLQYDFAYPANQYEANRVAFGTDVLPYYDIKNTDYLLSFGADYLGTWLSPVHYSAAYGHLRQGEDRHRGKCVQIEPRMSLSGANADEWIVATPGTEGLLAMAVAHGILAGGHYAGADAAEWTAALASYSPASVSKQTGVAAADIGRIAEEFMRAEAGLAIGGGGAAAGTNGVATLVAVNLLNYLSGNLGKPGGVLFNPDPVIAGAPKQRLASHADMLKLIVAMSGGEVEVLLLHQANPAYTLPPAAKFSKALGNVAHVVSLSSFMDETTAMADLILPTHTYLEAWGDDVPEPGVGVPVASISQPVVTPVFDTRATGDIILALAHQIGGELPAKLPWNQFEDYLKGSWQQIYAGQSEQDASFSFDDFWQDALKAGVWAEKNGSPAAPTGDPSDAFKQHLKMPPAAFDGDAGEYPFYLHPYLTQAFHDGRGANLPWMQELPDPLTSVVYASWVELNPQTAADMGVSEGDIIEVASPAGTIRAPAFLYPGIRPDVVAMPFGQGHAEYGRYAKDRGANPVEILGQHTDEDSGALAWAATRVKLRNTGDQVKLIKTDGVSRTLGRQILGPADSGHG